MGKRVERSLEEANLRGSDVEASERTPAGVVMCETRNLGIEWTQWHTLMFEGQEKVDMGVVCPHDVKKMLLKQAKTTFWSVGSQTRV